MKGLAGNTPVKPFTTYLYCEILESVKYKLSCLAPKQSCKMGFELWLWTLTFQCGVLWLIHKCKKSFSDALNIVLEGV